MCTYHHRCVFVRTFTALHEVRINAAHLDGNTEFIWCPLRQPNFLLQRGCCPHSCCHRAPRAAFIAQLGFAGQPERATGWSDGKTIAHDFDEWIALPRLVTWSSESFEQSWKLKTTQLRRRHRRLSGASLASSCDLLISSCESLSHAVPCPFGHLHRHREPDSDRTSSWTWIMMGCPKAANKQCPWPMTVGAGPWPRASSAPGQCTLRSKIRATSWSTDSSIGLSGLHPTLPRPVPSRGMRPITRWARPRAGGGLAPGPPLTCWPSPALNFQSDPLIINAGGRTARTPGWPTDQIMTPRRMGVGARATGRVMLSKYGS